jgi:hypothetical protein
LRREIFPFAIRVEELHHGRLRIEAT